MTSGIDEARRKARSAGLLYLLMGLIAPLGLIYVPGMLVVSENATATADNMPNVVNEVAALIAVSGAAFLSVFSKGQLDALAYLFLRLHSQGINVATIFWGLWLFPFGLLVIWSEFIPRVLGILLIIAGVGNVVSAATTVLLPRYAHQIDPVTTILGLGEIPIMIWLLFWGAREQS